MNNSPLIALLICALLASAAADASAQPAKPATIAPATAGKPSPPPCEIGDTRLHVRELDFQGKPIRASLVCTWAQIAWMRAPDAVNDTTGKSWAVDKARPSRFLDADTNDGLVDELVETTVFALSSAQARRCGLDQQAEMTHSLIVARQRIRSHWGEEVLTFLESYFTVVEGILTGRFTLEKRGDSSIDFKDAGAAFKPAATCSDNGKAAWSANLESRLASFSSTRKWLDDRAAREQTEGERLKHADTRRKRIAANIKTANDSCWGLNCMLGKARVATEISDPRAFLEEVKREIEWLAQNNTAEARAIRVPQLRDILQLIADVPGSPVASAATAERDRLEQRYKGTLACLAPSPGCMSSCQQQKDGNSKRSCQDTCIANAYACVQRGD